MECVLPVIDWIFFRFSRTDYAFAHALGEADDQRWIMLSYDIWCQYSVKLKTRFEKYFPRLAKLIPRIRGAVPKMHIKNHILLCQLLWAFNYMPYSGETWGENIESSWAEQNQTAGSTKEQNDGHRHDTLDDFSGYRNWTKYHEIGMCHSLYPSQISANRSSQPQHFIACTSIVSLHSRVVMISSKSLSGAYHPNDKTMAQAIKTMCIAPHTFMKSIPYRSQALLDRKSVV